MAEKMTGKECMRILKKHGISRDEFADYRGMKYLLVLRGVYGRTRIPVVYSRRVVCLSGRIGSGRHILRVHPCN